MANNTSELTQPLTLEQKSDLYQQISRYVKSNYRDSQLTEYIKAEIFAAKGKDEPFVSSKPEMSSSDFAKLVQYLNLYADSGEFEYLELARQIRFKYALSNSQMGSPSLVEAAVAAKLYEDDAISSSVFGRISTLINFLVNNAEEKSYPFDKPLGLAPSKGEDTTPPETTTPTGAPTLPEVVENEPPRAEASVIIPEPELNETVITPAPAKKKTSTPKARLPQPAIVFDEPDILELFEHTKEGRDSRRITVIQNPGNLDPSMTEVLNITHLDFNIFQREDIFGEREYLFEFRSNEPGRLATIVISTSVLDLANPNSNALITAVVVDRKRVKSTAELSLLYKACFNYIQSIEGRDAASTIEFPASLRKDFGKNVDFDFALSPFKDGKKAIHFGDTIMQIGEACGYAVHDEASDLLIVNGEFTISIVISRHMQTEAGRSRWKVRLDTSLRPDITVVVRMNTGNASAKDYYLLPCIDIGERASLKMADDNGFDLDAYRAEDLWPFFQLTRRTRLSASSLHCPISA